MNHSFAMKKAASWAMAALLAFSTAFGACALPAGSAHAGTLAPASVSAGPVNPTLDESATSYVSDFEYTLGYELHKTGQEDASHVNGMFDANVKFVRSGGAQTISLLVPNDATVYGLKALDMLEDVAIKTSAEGEEDAYQSAVKTVTAEGVEFSGLPVADIGETQELAFGVKGAVRHPDSTAQDYSTYQKADLVFTSMVTWWAGYKAQAPTALADGTYALDIVTYTGGDVDNQTSTTTFGKPVMGDNVFGDTMWVTVKDGSYAVSLDIEAVSGAYIDQARIYTRTGLYTQDAAPDNSLVDTTVLSRQRNADGSLYADGNGTNYADVISFDWSGKGANYYLFLRLAISAIPDHMRAHIEALPFVVLMKWDTLRKVDLPDSSKLDAAVTAAKKLSKDDYQDTGWTAFKNRLAQAKEVQKASHAMSQAAVDEVTSGLQAAQKALVKKETAVVTPAKPKTQTISLAKAYSNGTVTKRLSAAAFNLGASSNAKGAKLAYSTSNKKVATVSTKGVVTLKAPGTAKITVTSTASGYTTKTRTVTVKATLTAPTLAKSTKSAAKGKLTAAWGAVKGAQGYQLKVGSNAYTVKGAKTLKKTVSAAKGKKVQVKVRAYSAASGSKVYSGWSAVKSVTVKSK